MRSAPILPSLASSHRSDAMVLNNCRSLFTAGALAVIRYAKIHGTKHRPWLTALLARKPSAYEAMGEKCHQRSHAMQQILDHLVSAGEQLRWHVDAQRLGRSDRLAGPTLIWSLQRLHFAYRHNRAREKVSCLRSDLVCSRRP